MCGGAGGEMGELLVDYLAGVGEGGVFVEMRGWVCVFCCGGHGGCCWFGGAVVAREVRMQMRHMN